MPQLMVQVPADPLPSLIVRAEAASRGPDGTVSVRVALKNVGLSAALSVVLAGATPHLPGVSPQVTRTQRPLLGPTLFR